MPVDEHGVDVAALSSSGCEVVVVTPAHQFPTGVVLAPERRVELLEWAEDRDGLIIGDDYDSELRYDRVAVGALQGLAPERVCHAGSVSKRLAPALSLGWLLSPSWVTGDLTYDKALVDGGSPALEQLALADFIARGALDRHLRRMRLRYRARRRLLVEALGRELPGARVSGVEAGLHVQVLLGDGTDEQRLLSAAAAAGIGVEGLGRHRLTGLAWGGSLAAAGIAVPAGLVLGFGNASERAIAQGVALLGEAVRAAA